MTTVYPRTIKKTTASAVSRFLAANNFDRYNGEIGFTVYAEDTDYYGQTKDVVVVHKGYNNGYVSPIADELRAAGYIVVSDVTQGSWQNSDLNITIVVISGKAAN